MSGAQGDLTNLIVAFKWMSVIASIFLLPFLILGLIRKVKARMQNRLGPSVLQPFYDIVRLLRKDETVSSIASWLFRPAAAINAAVMIVLALMVPWLCYKPMALGADIFLVVYLFALSRFFTLLAALDTGSAFGAFGASREATLSTLVEPALILSLVSLGIVSHTSDLGIIFSFDSRSLSLGPAMWCLVGIGVLLSSLVELGRMPIDDPTTHLELTMIHEAMILERSGRNLALVEFAHALRMCVLFGLAGQCFLHAIPVAWLMDTAARAILQLWIMGLIAFGLAVFESTAVRLQWRRIPDFIAYCLTASLLASLIAIGDKLIK